MSRNESRITQLYRRMLEITEKEHEVIMDNNLEQMEQCCSIKEDLVREIEILKKSGAWISTREDVAETESILQKILFLNKANRKSVKYMQESILEEIDVQKKRKTAVKAYNLLSSQC